MTESKTAGQLFRKYILAGQHTSAEEKTGKHVSAEADALDRFVQRHRKLLSILIPLCFVQIIYWLLAYRNGFYTLFATRYEMSFVMILGAMVGGSTAEGGGVIAFPVLTLLLHVSAATARDYSAMIQSVGMTCAAFSVLFMQVVVERRTLVVAPLGSAVGVILSLTYLDGAMSAEAKKIVFVSIFFSFAIALFMLNRQKKRQTFHGITPFTANDAVVLFIVGFIGGTFSGIAGTGLELFVFSVLTLYFRVSEKVATPTATCLASMNSILIFFWRHQMEQNIDSLAWEYLAVTIPVCVIFAPLGALLSSHLHRLAIASITYVLETLTLVVAFAIIRPGWDLCLLSVSVLGAALLFYYGLAQLGERRMASVEGKLKHTVSKRKRGSVADSVSAMSVRRPSEPLLPTDKIVRRPSEPLLPQEKIVRRPSEPLPAFEKLADILQV